MKYAELRDRHLKEINDFPIKFAFDYQQFKQMMKEWGLHPKRDINRIVAIKNTGGFIRRTDFPIFMDINRRHKAELRQALENDDFFTEACIAEFANHEMCYNHYQGHYDVLTTLGFKLKDINRENEEDYYNEPKNFDLTEHQLVLYELALMQYFKNIGTDY